MATTYADFIVRFPEFATVTQARIELFISDAAGYMGTAEERWLTFYNVAQEYLTAHLLVAAQATAAGDTGGLFPVKKQEVDDVTVEFAVADVSATAEDLNSTSYGKRYVGYRRICFAGIRGA